MDSITQITLGAAVGEVVLGRKIGNRAMVWGGVAGTIPDLDVLANLVMSEIDALAFHRGFTHSIVFAVLASLLMGWLVSWLYRWKYRRIAGFVGWIGFVGLIVFFVNSSASAEQFNWRTFLFTVIPFLLFVAWSYRKYFLRERPPPGVSTIEWMHLFFWSIITHPILDSFTVFGTQLFQPFTNTRVALNNISVADPFYTAPFLLCLIIAAFFHRSSKWRRIFLYAGIGISSLYMIWTFTNKIKVDRVMKDTLIAQELAHKRYMTAPTILNNFLWYCAAETDSTIAYGLYSLFDEEKKVELQHVPKNHEWLHADPDDHTINTLKWFSDDYFTLIRRSDGRLQLNDMRYGTFRDENDGENDYIFRFVLERNDDGRYQLDEAEGGPPEDVDEGKMLRELIERIKGI